MEVGLNHVKHGMAPTNSLSTGTQTGRANVYMCNLCAALLLISQPSLKLTWITITLYKRVCICCLSCRVEMGLCVCVRVCDEVNFSSTH